MSATDNERAGEEVPETVEEGGSLLVVDASITLPNKTVVVVSGLSAAETIASVRQILGEYQETAAITAYELQLVGTTGTDGATTEVDVACPEYTEIATLVQENTTTLLFNLVPSEYNLKKVQDQVKRTNEVLANPPSLKGVVSKKTESAAPAAEPKVDTTLPKADDLFKPIDFGAFYGEVLFRTGDVETVSKNARMASNKPLAEAVKSVFASGWNPPPPQRKVRGDLLYIEVVTANEGTLYITAVPSGFYVNKSNRAHFDATPATNHCFSHELLDTLLKASATLKAAWATAVTSRVITPSEESPMDVMAWLYAQGRGHQAADAGLAKPQWNAYNSDAYKNFLENTEATSARTVDSSVNHHYNQYRAQAELSSLHGVPELGAPREWNDEIQSIRALKAGDVNEKIMKAKLEYKVLSEFAAACRATAVAITEGLIAPLSFGDPSQSEIYVYNGIFFSKAEDSKDSFKICNGDEAYKKSTSRELQNQRLIRTLDIEGVGLILCAIIDYKGQRIIGQSIIPGIFAQGDNVARLMYGILEKEKILTVKNSALKVMKEVCAKLHIPERTAQLFPFGQPSSVGSSTDSAVEAEAKEGGMLDEAQGSAIKVDVEDNVTSASSGATTTPFVGPIEGKVLRGSDGRDYLLEMMRLTPRDANYVRGDKGTGKVATLEGTDADLAVAYVLRPELVNLYVQRRLNLERQKVMIEASAQQKELLAAVTAKNVEAAAGKSEAEKEAAATAEPSLDEETMARLTTEYTNKIRDITVASLGLEVNPNAFLDFQIDVDAAVVAKDEQTARDLALFLWDTVLPAVTKQVRDGDIQVKDNASMVKLLHRNGVNMRYLGALSTLAAAEEVEDETLLQEGKQKVHAMPHFWREMLTVEVIARAVKYVLNGLFKQSDAVFQAPAQTIASLLNHVLSALVAPVAPAPVAATAAVETAATATTSGKNAKKNNKKGKAEAAPVVVKAAAPAVVEDKVQLPIFTSPDATVSREASLKAVQDTISARFCLALPLVSSADATDAEKVAFDAVKTFLQTRLSAIAVLRRICQVNGIQIATRKYDFTSETIFHAADIVSLVPVVKSCEPDMLLPEFHEMLESAQTFQQEGNHAYAYEMAQQALNTITQITGPYHIHAAQAVDVVGNVLIAAGDYAAAEQYAQKSLAISLQLHGFDSQECVLQHVKMGVLEGELGHRAAAAKHFLSAKYILQVATGDRHSELSTVFARLASLYDEAGDFEAVWQCYVKAKFHTSDLMQICTLNIALASACSRNGHNIEALELQRQAYSMLKELVGEKDEAQLSEIKATLEQYLRTVNEEKQASFDLVNERLEKLTLKAGQQQQQGQQTKTLQTKGKDSEQNTVVASAPLNDEELLKAFAEIDARNKKAAKNAAKKTATKAKK